jgi:hypothetical protein
MEQEKTVEKTTISFLSQFSYLSKAEKQKMVEMIVNTNSSWQNIETRTE